MRKDPKHGWYVEWDYSEGRTVFGDDCGIKDGEIHQTWRVIEPEQIQKSSRLMSCEEIKSANTSSDSISCVKCNGPLKDLGMGPQFKFCPVCEP